MPAKESGQLKSTKCRCNEGFKEVLRSHTKTQVGNNGRGGPVKKEKYIRADYGYTGESGKAMGWMYALLKALTECRGGFVQCLRTATSAVAAV